MVKYNLILLLFFSYLYPSLSLADQKANWLGYIEISPSLESLLEKPSYPVEQEPFQRKPHSDKFKKSAYSYKPYKFVNKNFSKESNKIKTDVVSKGNKIERVGIDSDGDGVWDKYDRCPLTYRDMLVNKLGCRPVTLTLFKVFFGMGDYELKDSEILIIKESMNLLKQRADSEFILIVGHTDNVGTLSRNIQLSWNRAQSVKDYLVNEMAVDESIIMLAAEGEIFPGGVNTDLKKQKNNRRVEIKTVSIANLPVKARLRMPEEMKGYTRYPVDSPRYAKWAKENYKKNLQ